MIRKSYSQRKSTSDRQSSTSAHASIEIDEVKEENATHTLIRKDITLIISLMNHQILKLPLYPPILIVARDVIDPIILYIKFDATSHVIELRVPTDIHSLDDRHREGLTPRLDAIGTRTIIIIVIGSMVHESKFPFITFSRRLAEDHTSCLLKWLWFRWLVVPFPCSG